MDEIQSSSGNPATQADFDFAARLLNSGSSSEDVQRQLVERGLDQESAAATVRTVMMQSIYAEAARLLNSGVSPNQAAQRLAEKGLEPQFARSVIDHLVTRAQRPAGPPTGGSVVLQLFGGLVLVVGIGLFIGNITGLFPTFPFAGFIGIGIGGAILRAGQRAG